MLRRKIGDLRDLIFVPYLAAFRVTFSNKIFYHLALFLRIKGFVLEKKRRAIVQ
jgi:hypothetical protein